MLKLLLSCMSLSFLVLQTGTPARRSEVHSRDNAVLPVSGALLYNNVYGKGTITDYRQSVFSGPDGTGWEWTWPANGGTDLKVYPEILIGRSPWSDAPGLAGTAGLAAGSQLPERLAAARQTIRFDFNTAADGLWLASFDFWITSSDHPTEKDIVSNLCLWTVNHGVTPSEVYKGRHMRLKIGGRMYDAIFETPKERPEKHWNTLCLIDLEPRTKGSLDLAALMHALVAHGLAKSTDFLATAELGTEVATGEGRTTLRDFSLK